MPHAGPADPDPRNSPDLDAGGSPTGPQTPDSHSTSLDSDSAARKQSPTEQQSPPPQPGRKGPYVWIVVIGIVVALLVIGLLGYAFEVF